MSLGGSDEHWAGLARRGVLVGVAVILFAWSLPAASAAAAAGRGSACEVPYTFHFGSRTLPSGSCRERLAARAPRWIVYVGQRFWVRADGTAPLPRPRGPSVQVVERRGDRAWYEARSAGSSPLWVKGRRFCGHRRRCVALIVHVEAAIPGALYVGYPYASVTGDPDFPGPPQDEFELRVSPDGTRARFATEFPLSPCGNGDDLNPSPQDWPAIPIAPDGSFSTTATLGNSFNASTQTISGAFEGAVANVEFVFTLTCALGPHPMTETYTLRFRIASQYARFGGRWAKGMAFPTPREVVLPAATDGARSGATQSAGQRPPASSGRCWRDCRRWAWSLRRARRCTHTS
jgi:hypothetical protein